MRTGRSGEGVAKGRGIFRRVPARQSLRLATFDSVVRGVSNLPRDASGPHVEQRERSAGSRLVPARLSMDDERAFDRQPRQRFGHQAGDLETERADHHERRFGRIREGTEDVEYGPDAQRLPHRYEGLHRRVIMWSEQEREPRVLQTRAGPGFVEREPETEGLEHVGASAPARDGAISVLHDRKSAGCRQEGRARREVQASRSIPAGPDDIDGACPGGQNGPAGQRTHGASKSADLVCRLPLETKAGKEGAGHRSR